MADGLDVILGDDQVKAVSKRNRVLIGGLSSFGTPGQGPGRNMGPLRFTREQVKHDGAHLVAVLRAVAA